MPASDLPASDVPASELLAAVVAEVDDRADELIRFRRDLHAHPELSRAESRTTGLVAARMEQAGARVTRFERTGLVAELGPESGPVVALRADLDALPVDDLTTDPWRSTVEGVTHACGHDVHTTAVLGAGLALAAHADRLTRPVRLVFQPAEEVMPGGAHEVIQAGVLKDVSSIFALHCDPGLDVGTIGLREGPLTGAADMLAIDFSGRGGHTSRPHLTQDLTFAMAKVMTELPSVLSRRLDPRAGVSVVWGKVSAGKAGNVIPAKGRLVGTVRMLDSVAWNDAEHLITAMVDQLLAPYAVRGDVHYTRGVPPVINEHRSTRLLEQAASEVLGDGCVVPIPQSLGGEDFAWYLVDVPGAMARLGTRTPGGPTYDLHQGDLRVDERCVAIGAKVLLSVVLAAIRGG